MKFFGIEIGSKQEAVPDYTDEQYQQYMDGFATGYPLIGQPDYPVHDTAAYQRGVRLGRERYEKAGRPQAHYEE